MFGWDFPILTRKINKGEWDLGTTLYLKSYPLSPVPSRCSMLFVPVIYLKDEFSNKFLVIGDKIPRFILLIL
jgi:hypothetical protein